MSSRPVPWPTHVGKARKQRHDRADRAALERRLQARAQAQAARRAANIRAFHRREMARQR